MSPLNDSVWIIIPAYNESSVLADVLQGVLKLYSHVVVVDDGSTDSTLEIARRFPVHRLHHVVNLGQGAAIQTGLDYALGQNAAFVVTFDADGQMSETDIQAVCEPLRTGTADIVFGSRFLSPQSNTPTFRKYFLKTAAFFIRLTSGIRLTDAHNGFRAMTRATAEKINLRQNGMAHASELVHQVAKWKLRYVEAAVTIKYTAYSLRKGQRLTNALNILWDLVFRR